LKHQPGNSVSLSFAQVEKIIGDRLPISARHPWWWANNKDPNKAHRVQAEAWKDAGWNAHPDFYTRSVTFTR